ncbi:gluconokinase [Marinimicrobium alkaliphilum]|uniref:gluconokinase n=1 Tax=Marinimicrobium alkaliphilum TaxID=2202654 RepID=UPI000DB9EF97|nr:gluconokinase, GntK/IdnK-type [Marinimicrobium alkaliphilum]
MPHAPPMLLVVMGVSGCGKSVTAKRLAQALGIPFLDADDFHTPEARKRMTEGRPLDDAMRAPWIASLSETLSDHRKRGQSCTLAFSGLRRQHREALRQLDFCTHFFWLTGDKALIRERLEERRDHFMPVSLLDSQFDSLESPADEKDVTPLDTHPPLNDVVDNALNILKQRALIP